MEFNSKLTVERNKLLKSTILKKSNELERTNETLKDLNKKKEDLLSVLQDTDTFHKFKTYPRALAKTESELVSLKEKLNKIDLILSQDERKEKLSSDLDELIVDIKKLSITTRV